MKKSTGLAVLGFGVLFATMLGVQVSMSTAPGGYGVAHAQGQPQQQSGQRAGQARPTGQAQQARVPEYDVRPICFNYFSGDIATGVNNAKAFLNKASKDGWELVSASPTSNIPHQSGVSKDCLVLILRRAAK